MSEKCKFCGAETERTNAELIPDFVIHWFACGRDNLETKGDRRPPDCYERQIAALEAELKQLRDEDDTPPIDERLAAAGKIFRELVAEREELRREVTRLRDELAEAKQ